MKWCLEKIFPSFITVIAGVIGVISVTAQTPTQDCENTLRDWRGNTRDPAIVRFMAMHTCTCPSPTSQPRCVPNNLPGDPNPQQPVSPEPDGVSVGNSAAIEAARAEAEQRRRQEAFEATKRELLKTLKTGQPADNVNLGLKPGTATPKVCPSGTTLSGGSCVADTPVSSSEFLYALQTNAFDPMNDGGTLAETGGPPPKDGHGLVGGTTWTFGFKRPHSKCDQKCTEDIETRLKEQLAEYCRSMFSTEKDESECIDQGLPFTPDIYDMVVSVATYHNALEDLATRVIFDGAAYGEYSRQHQELFSRLKGRNFDGLDCHSNGAMLCLAALRSGEATAREVRLFGPQITPSAAAAWQQLAFKKNIVIKVYINTGDPVPAASWKQPIPKRLDGTAETSPTAIWIHTIPRAASALADAAFYSLMDSRHGVMDEALEQYGLTVFRSECKGRPTIACHSMKVYEANLPENDLPPIPVRPRVRPTTSPKK